MIEYYLYLIIFAFCLVGSGFFSGAEVALFSITRAKVRTLVSDGVPGSNRLAELKKDPDRFLITILIGNNIVNILGTSIATALAVHFFGETGLAIVISTFVVVFLLLVFGEIGPKMYATRNSASYALWSSSVILILSKLFYPVIKLFKFISNRLSGGSTFSQHLITEEEIKEWIDVGQEEGTIEKDEQELLHSVFDFGDTRVREVMTPRVDVMLIEETATPKEALNLFNTTGFSRIPVYHGNTDTIIGVLNVKDLFGAVLESQNDEKVNSVLLITKLTSEPFFIPETKKISDLLREMRIQKTHMTIVLDEYGNFVGIVTVEDIVEELVGEILDEFDKEELDLIPLTNGIYSIDAQLWIEDLNKELSINLPLSESYETIAGLLIDRLGYIPKIGESCVLEESGITLIVIQMKSKRITRMKMIIPEQLRDADKETSI